MKKKFLNEYFFLFLYLIITIIIMINTILNTENAHLQGMRKEPQSHRATALSLVTH